MSEKKPTKNNHLVPDSYQRRWQLSDKPGWIGVYTSSGKYETRPIKHNAAREEFYTPELEEGLQPLESEYGKAVKQIIARRPLYLNRKQDVIRFMVAQLQRTEVGHSRTEDFIQHQAEPNQKEVETWFEEQIRSSGAPPDIAEAMLEKMRRDSTEVLQRLRQGHLTKSVFSGAALQPLPTFEKGLVETPWEFFVSGPGQTKFLTCDNPLIMPGSAQLPIFHFPITPELCLVIRVGSTAGDYQYTDVRDEVVDGINRRIIAAASREVYAVGDVLSPDDLSPMSSEVWAETLAPDQIE